MQKPKFSIYVKYENGTGGYLSVRDRTEWAIKTAKKHLKDVIREKTENSAKWSEVRYFAIVEA